MGQQWNLERVKDMWQRGSRRHFVSFLDPFGATPHGFTHFNNSMCNNHCSQFHRRLQASRETAWCCGLNSEKWRVWSCTGIKYPRGVVEMKSLWQPMSYELNYSSSITMSQTILGLTISVQQFKKWFVTANAALTKYWVKKQHCRNVFNKILQVVCLLIL